MDAPADFARGVETRNGLQVVADHFGLRRNGETAHRVVDARPEADRIELALIYLRVVEDLRVEGRILLRLHGFVPGLERRQEGVLRDLMEVGQGFRRIKGLDDALFQARLQGFRRDVSDVVDAHRQDRGMSRRDDRVGADLAVAGFVHEALPGFRIDHEAVAHDRLDDLGRHAEALFVGRGPGSELNPVHLNVGRADALRRHQGVARGAGLVRRFKLRPEARVVKLAKFHVLREAAARQDEALLHAHAHVLPALFVRELVAFRDHGARDAAVFNDDVNEARAVLNLDAEALGLFNERLHELGAVTLHVGRASRHRVAAVEGEAVELHADHVADPFVGRKGVVRHHAGEFLVHEAAARLQHVAVELIGRVLDARGLLQVASRRGDAAAAERGVAAEHHHLFNQKRIGPGRAGFDRGAEARVARTHDEDVAFAVPGSGGFRRVRGVGGARHQAGTRESEDVSTGKLVHVSLLVRSKNISLLNRVLRA